MDYLPKEGYKKILVLSLYGVLGLIFAYVFLKYILKLLLPFIIALCISTVIRPLALTLHKRTRVSKKIISIFLVLILLLVIGVFLFITVDKLLYEIRGIMIYLNDNADGIINTALNGVNKLLEKVPFLKTFGSEEEMLRTIAVIGQEMLTGMTANVPEILAKIITALPGVLFVALILIMASYYFSADYDKIMAYISSKMPLKIAGISKKGTDRIKRAIKSVAKGYMLTIGITFLLLYIGLLIIGKDYALTIALITALIDILPVIGVGTVLIPWAIINLIAGANYQAFALLILFVIVSVVREIIEPKIIGKSIGLHPLATLFFMYIGLETCGFLGMILFPVFVIGLKTAVSVGMENIKNKKP